MNRVSVTEFGARRGIKRNEIGPPLHCDGLIARISESHFWFERRVTLNQKLRTLRADDTANIQQGIQEIQKHRMLRVLWISSCSE